MKLISFGLERGSKPRIGVVLDGDEVFDLGTAGGAPFDTSSMISLIEAGQDALGWVRDATAKPGDTLSLGKLHLFAPIPRPRKNVFCVGWNYLEHFEEGAKSRTTPVDLPDHPVFFSKATTAVCGPYDNVDIDRMVTQKLDWEVELGVVIGTFGRNITEADAMRHVWGYTVINDMTGRDIQRQHGQQWFKGKSLDGTCPIGPYIVTADVVNPADLHLTCRVNGHVKQDSSTSCMYFKIPRLLSELSHGLSLEPGDIIATGTPSGVGHARNPPEFLQTGDVLESEIDGLGRMRNRIG